MQGTRLNSFPGTVRAIIVLSKIVGVQYTAIIATIALLVGWPWPPPAQKTDAPSSYLIIHIKPKPFWVVSDDTVPGVPGA